MSEEGLSVLFVLGADDELLCVSYEPDGFLLKHVLIGQEELYITEVDG